MALNNRAKVNPKPMLNQAVGLKGLGVVAGTMVVASAVGEGELIGVGLAVGVGLVRRLSMVGLAVGRGFKSRLEGVGEAVPSFWVSATTLPVAAAGSGVGWMAGAGISSGAFSPAGASASVLPSES